MNSQTFQTMRNSANTGDAVGILLCELIDYAELFPPASLAMGTCVVNYDAYSRSKWNWILGRFIVPVARLGEFKAAVAALPASAAPADLSDWRLSVLLGVDPVSDVARIREFNTQMENLGCGRNTVVECVEVKVARPEEIKWLSEIIPSELEAYFEFPLSSCGECIAAIAECRRRAKIRTGGETADKFPSAGSVIEFIRQCAAANVPFKATAGLHHPLRSVQRLTYKPDSPSGFMHGFLNVFLAAAFLRAGMENKIAIQLLEEQSPQAFRFDLDGVGWREHRISRHEIATARKHFAILFGSCSFTEPIEDLRSLHLL
jgi:hypothetical protein